MISMDWENRIRDFFLLLCVSSGLVFVFTDFLFFIFYFYYFFLTMKHNIPVNLSLRVVYHPRFNILYCLIYL